jgi:hypothetical protein
VVRRPDYGVDEVQDREDHKVRAIVLCVLRNVLLKLMGNIPHLWTGALKQSDARLPLLETCEKRHRVCALSMYLRLNRRNNLKW